MSKSKDDPSLSPFGEYRLTDGHIETYLPHSNEWVVSAHDGATVEDIPQYEANWPTHPVIPILKQKFADHLEENRMIRDGEV